jgi:hypothetical protein
VGVAAAQRAGEAGREHGHVGCDAERDLCGAYK